MDRASHSDGCEFIVSGRIIAPGIAFGFVHFDEVLPPVSSVGIGADEVDTEIDRLKNAVSIVHRDLETHIREFHDPAEEDFQQILSSHLLMLDDREFFSSVFNGIKENLVPAEVAVQEVFSVASARLGSSRDSYLRARSEDIRDICQAIQRALMLGEMAFQPAARDRTPAVIITPHIHPSVVLRARNSAAAAVVTPSSSLSSHGAILLRALGIPSVGGISFPDGVPHEGTPILVDAVNGTVHLRPAGQTKNIALNLAKRLERIKSKDAPSSLDAYTADGRAVRLRANIEHPSQTSLCLHYRLDGIGLFRTEFMILTSGRVPDEAEQFRAYREVVDRMAGRPIVFRTFDIGGDKVTTDLHRCSGSNPALGVRGIRRHLLRVPGELHTQMRALLRAARDADVALLFPLVTHAGDLAAAKEILEKVKDELEREHLPFNGNIKTGAMIEVPSAALQIRAILEAADFVSVGTNDLLQYLTATDRDNPEVEVYQNYVYSGLRPLLKLMMDQARSVGRGQDVSVCGELASDPEGAKILVELGIESLSISPGAAPAVRDAIGTIQSTR